MNPHTMRPPHFLSQVQLSQWTTARNCYQCYDSAQIEDNVRNQQLIITAALPQGRATYSLFSSLLTSTDVIQSWRLQIKAWVHTVIRTSALQTHISLFKYKSQPAHNLQKVKGWGTSIQQSSSHSTPKTPLKDFCLHCIQLCARQHTATSTGSKSWDYS